METPEPSSAKASWLRSRYGFVLFCLLFLIAWWTLLRLGLLLGFKPAGLSASGVLLSFLSGLQRDAFMACCEVLPLLVWFAIVPNGQFGARWHRILFSIGFFVWVYAQLFLLVVEFFFFEEFKSRFNTVAVDYLLYPYEVFVNIWESYHVGVFLVGCFVLALVAVALVSKLFPDLWSRPFPARGRFGCIALLLALIAVQLPALNLKGAHISTDRTLNEIANNGGISFLAAAWTHHLDYAAFYKTMPRDQAYEVARRALAENNATFDEPANSIRRRVAGDSSRPKLNLVVILEESLGSEFWGCLGRTNSLTPEMDRLAVEEGLLFENLYACGNRTVRGMEGVLSSFPPLPGDSIVKRDRSDNIETVARVLKRDGYSTCFLYGGRGVFDGMRSYAVRNGYDRFIEQKHFKDPTFTTIWGVCDEDLMARGITECRELAAKGTPFFATLLTVSNHKPYTYPKGRIPENPDQKRRRNAVKYTDFALGEFFRAAKKEAFWTNTIFAVIADHGARVYGKQTIPIHSYEIPLVILGPAAVKSAARVSRLGSSLDVGPTLLGLIGRPYETLFFGRDLLAASPARGRALLNHNRDIGMLVDDRMVVLGLMQGVEFYQGQPKRTEMTLLETITDRERDLEQEATALFQVADELYTKQLYHLDPSPAH